MSMNKDSFNYIKSTFPTKQHIIDYIKEIEKFKSDSAIDDPVTGAPAYASLVRLFSKEGSEVQASADTQTYGNQKLPSAKKIFIPDKTDITWMALRTELIKKSVLAFNYQIEQVSDVNIRDYLKKHFDEKLPDPKSNIALDDPVFDTAWKKYYENVNSANSLFGSPYNGAQAVILAFADAVVLRLNTFDVNATEPPKKATPVSNDPTSTATGSQSGTTNTDIAPSAERLEALATFLVNAEMIGPGLDPVATLILNVTERNSLPMSYREKLADQNRYNI